MKTSINKLCIAASILVTAAGISACVDDNKTLYDPEYKTPNPMEEISAPTGFDWSSTHAIKFNVEVNDEFDGQYYYTVEIVDKNPLEATAEEPYNTLRVNLPYSVLFYRYICNQNESFCNHQGE